MTVLKVSAQSNPKAVAGAMASIVREIGSAEMQAVGAGAVNQSMKAIAIARGYLAPGGINLVAIPSFVEIEIEGLVKTAMHFRVEPR
jgi:stage V sporulation protein S